jgi:hypothetical protein
VFVYCLLFLKKEAARPAETLITVYHITYVPEEGNAKVKLKITLEQAMKFVRGDTGIALLFL